MVYIWKKFKTGFNNFFVRLLVKYFSNSQQKDETVDIRGNAANMT